MTIRRVIIVGLVTGATVIGGFAMVRGDETPPGPAATAPATAASNPHGDVVAASDADPLPVVADGGGQRGASQPDTASGFARSEQGARRAAVAFLELSEEVVEMSPSEAAAFQRPFATADFADESAAETERRMIELLNKVPAGVTVRLAPLEIRSVSEGEEWIVSIWFVEAISIGHEGVVDDWRTATYRLRWEDGEWRVAGFDSVRGPMPGRGSQAASATPSQFEALLAGFDDEGLN